MRLHDLFEIGGKVTRVAGDNLELDGGAVKIDLKKFDVDMSTPNKPKLKKKKPSAQAGTNSIRPGQDLEIATEDEIDEGVNDPHIFKAIFLAGGPGSGKSFVSKKLLGGTGLKVVNSDDVYEYLMTKQDLELKPEVIGSPQGQEVRAKAKSMTKSREAQYIDGRLGLVIDGTGKDPNLIERHVNKLRAIGYDVGMIFVNTNLEIAQQRNLERNRSLPPEMVEKIWNDTQQNIMKYQQIFKADNFFIVDNSGGLEDPTRSENFDKVYNNTQKFINAPVGKKATKWIEKEKQEQLKQ
jgi:dephospho-CoA kinase